MVCYVGCDIMKKEQEFGAFCELYGKTIRNLIIEYLLENKGLDFAVGDMANELNISRPKAYELIKEFEKDKLVEKSRIVSGTQLYKLNEVNRRVKQLLKNFKECLKLILEEQSEKRNNNISNSSCSVGMACAKGI